MPQQYFKLQAKHAPAGDQPQAIQALYEGLKEGLSFQTLLGVTGSGKTFSMAELITRWNRPTLVIAHNKTLAAQLAQEYRDYFPDHAVHYFVSYYDYYQPEAYMPGTDTYIEKDAQINEEIDRLRHASTQALLTRQDVIIVASVSCIYGLGSPEEYKSMHLSLSQGMPLSRKELLQALIDIHYERVVGDLRPGTFRALGQKIEVMPMSEKVVYAIELASSEIQDLLKINPISSQIIEHPKEIMLFPAKHFLTEGPARERALKLIDVELKDQIALFEKEEKILELERIKRRTTYDMAMIREVGYCSGIENYSRHLSGKKQGEAPETLLSYFPKTKDGKPDFLTIIDESHVTLSQIGAMFNGDQARKKTLVEHGFRLPSALDNRPLRFEEFLTRVGPLVCTTATPGKYEKEHSQKIVEQIIRPTGLIDPEISIFPVSASLEEGTKYPGQVQHFIQDAVKEIKEGGRVLATTLTKKMAEDLSIYLKEQGIKAEYLHSDIETLDRIKILTSLRKGIFDCLIGVNLLREGLDLPELTLVAILDADKAGFLRSETSLIQTIGRAARNVKGRVTLYADTITDSMQYALDETRRRRSIQLAYNTKHKITPQTVTKAIKDITDQLQSDHSKAVADELALDRAAFGGNLKKLIKYKEGQMKEAVQSLDFESAALIRDELKILRKD